MAEAEIRVEQENKEKRVPIMRENVRFERAGGAVDSVNGQTGDVVLTTSDLENTSDYQTGTDVAEDINAAIGALTIPTKTSDLVNDGATGTSTYVEATALSDEATARENADNGLQGQIDALSAASDVTDIVGTYAALEAYDTSKLKDNDIIKVLQDETHDDETTYYRWDTETETFTLIGEEGPYYTKSAADQKFQDKLTAGTNISIDPLTDTISASFDAETIFYANLNETGNNRHIYKDIGFTTAASVQEIIDANNEGQVILRGTSTANPTAYSDSYLQNAFIMPHNNDFEFVFLDRDLRYEYTASATTDTVFFYSTSEIQPKLTEGANINISGTTISATDTTYSDFTGATSLADGAAGLVPKPLIADKDKYLKGDGTWDTVAAGPTVVQTTGTSTTDVMSQDATTKMIYPDITNKPTAIRIGSTNATAADSIAIGATSNVWQQGIAIGKQAAAQGTDAIAIGYLANVAGADSVAVGKAAFAFHNSSVALGHSSTGRNYEVSIGKGSGYGLASTRYLANVKDPQLAQDAATKNYVDGDTETYTIADTDWSALTGAGIFTYSATVTATHAIGASTIAELINDQAVLFSTYGFAIGDITGQTVTIYSIGAPSSSVSLKINYKG